MRGVKLALIEGLQSQGCFGLIITIVCWFTPVYQLIEDSEWMNSKTPGQRARVPSVSVTYEMRRIHQVKFGLLSADGRHTTERNSWREKGLSSCQIKAKKTKTCHII